MCNVSFSSSSLLQLAPAANNNFFNGTISDITKKLEKKKQRNKTILELKFQLFAIWIYKILNRTIGIPLPVNDALSWSQVVHGA